MNNNKENNNKNINMNNNKENKNINIIPVVKYANLDKSIIYKENINKTGVYRLVNNINDKSFIGSSIHLSNTLSAYYSLNSLKRKVKGSIIIHRALSKYGYSNFSLEIIEFCEAGILIEREQYYIDLLKPEYNIKVVSYKS
jgi:GIY-YIG catalytic domain